MVVAVPVLLAIALAVVVAMWLLGGSGAGGGLAEEAGITGVIEYSVHDSSGKLLQHRVINNTTTSGLLNAASGRLSVAQTVTTAQDVYEDLQLCNVNNTGDVCTTAQLIANIKSAVGGAANNPAGTGDVVVSGPAGVADGVGSYQVVDTFFCGGTCAQILKLELTAGAGAAGTADSTLGAYQAVSVTLASGDSLQVTWTVDID